MRLQGGCAPRLGVEAPPHKIETLGNDAATEAPAMTPEPMLARIIYQVVLVVPLICAAVGLTGFVTWTAMGLPLDYTAVWLGLTMASLSWAFTHWFCLVRQKRD